MEMKKLQQIVNDREYVESLLKLETAQQVKDSLAQKGVDLSIEDVNYLKGLFTRYLNDELSDDEKKMINTFNDESSELSDEQLDAVTGGCDPIGITLFVLMVVSFAALGTHNKTRGRW